jgi:hypothetical protein
VLVRQRGTGSQRGDSHGHGVHEAVDVVDEQLVRHAILARQFSEGDGARQLRAVADLQELSEVCGLAGAQVQLQREGRQAQVGAVSGEGRDGEVQG